MKKGLLTVCIIALTGLYGIDLYAVNDNSVGTSAGDFVKVGAAGAEMLKIPVGARANGMGGAYGAVADDMSSVFWNPAGLGDIKAISADFSYTSWFAGFKHYFAGAALPVGTNFTAAFSIFDFSSDDIEITTIEQPQGTGLFYNVNDLALCASFAGYLTDQFSFGVTAKYISLAFTSLKANGIAFDVGTKYATGIQGITLGFSIHNLGTQETYSGQDLNTTKKLYTALYASPIDASYLATAFSIPLTFRAGISSKIIDEEDNKLLVAADFITISDVPEQYALGAEYTWRDFVAVRAGYEFGQDQFGFGGGLGLKYAGQGFQGQIDYSINPTKDLGLINRLSIYITMK